MKRKIDRIFIRFGLALWILFFSLTPVLAQGTVVRVSPNPVQVPAGQNAQVVVEIVDAVDLYGFDITLTFDANAVEIVDSNLDRPGVQVALGAFLDSGLELKNEVDNQAGRARYAMTQLNPTQPKSGSGVLLVVILRGKVVGKTTDLILENVKLARRDGVAIPSVLETSSAQVVTSFAGPTSTIAPTHGVGTPLADLQLTVTAIPVLTATNTKVVKQSASKSPTATSTQPLANVNSATRTVAAATSTSVNTTPIPTITPVQPPTDIPQIPTEGITIQVFPTSTLTATPLVFNQTTPIPDKTSSVGFSSLLILVGVGVLGGVLGFGLSLILSKRHRGSS